MPRFASVVAKSPLIQLDRAFDFIVPAHLESSIQVGQSVRFPFGRAKKPLSGFVVELLDSSEFATNEILDIEDASPVIFPETLRFIRQVADRQCVAIGEILAQAVPDHMSTIPKLAANSRLSPAQVQLVAAEPKLSPRAAVLTSGGQIRLDKQLVPDWAALLAQEALATYINGQSSILIVPERSDLDALVGVFKLLGHSDLCTVLNPGQKKSTRFQLFHQIAMSEQSIVLGTRSAVYMPAQNLGLIGLHDDLDDSLREQGSPYTNARELALMRASGDVKLIFTAPYRSTEIQRLVEIGYLSDHLLALPPPKVSFTEPGIRMDQAGFQLVRQCLEAGPVLVLLPRKGDSAAVFCGGCGEKLGCSCGGYYWQPTAGQTICRVCSRPFVACQDCQSRQIKKGRTGSNRQVSELGRAFPNVVITEASGGKKPSGLKSKNQIVVATPGSAPRFATGYSAVLILDCDVWLSRQSLNAESLANRDWMEAIELLAPEGRALLAGVPRELGSAVAIGQHRALAMGWLSEARETNLPPAARICTLEADRGTLQSAIDAARQAGAELIRTDLERSSALIRFSYSNGAAVAKALRGVAAGALARTVGANKRRGLKIAMDDPEAL